MMEVWILVLWFSATPTSAYGPNVMQFPTEAACQAFIERRTDWNTVVKSKCIKVTPNICGSKC